MSLPSRIARYEIAGRLAAGGMAEILLGRLTGPSGFERAVVVKRILPHLAAEETFRTMFLDEARIVARIRHPNVVQVQELGEDGAELYLAMEYLEGESLSTLLRRLVAAGQTMDRALVAYVIAQACAGLHAAHELADENGNSLHVVHRDVSPQNVFVSYRGEVKILDFGIAKTADRIARTATGVFKGKVAYSPREQCLGLPLDRRADVFGLGVILYELTTGLRLFKRDSDLLTMEAICAGDVPPPSSVVGEYPPALERVCLRALARMPEDRHPTAAALRTDLLRVARELGLDPEPDDSLAGMMRALFADRIALKTDLLRRVEVGSNVGSIPSNESDAEVAVPVVEATLRGSSVFSPPAPDRDEETVPTRRRRALRLGLAAGAIVLLLGISGVGLRWRALSARAPAISPAPAASAGSVTLAVASTPAGAEIFVDGESHGLSPATLVLPRGSGSRLLVLRKAGFADVEQTVVPDVDQRLVITLVVPLPAASSAGSPKLGPRHRAPASKPSSVLPLPAPLPAPPSASASVPYRRFD